MHRNRNDPKRDARRGAIDATDDELGDSPQDDGDDVHIVELTDELDLHTFAPRDVKELVCDYIDACLDRGFPRVRIIHGKGTGTLRRIVHAALERHDGVVSFALAPETAGGWGATIAVLRTS
jgi:dsDNA-specific endonuclease/ATPase MutS2